MHLVYPSKFCVTFVLDYSWDDSNTQGKLETVVAKYCEVNMVHYGLCENGERNTKLFLFNVFSLQKAQFIV